MHASTPKTTSRTTTTTTLADSESSEGWWLVVAGVEVRGGMSREPSKKGRELTTSDACSGEEEGEGRWSAGAARQGEDEGRSWRTANEYWKRSTPRVWRGGRGGRIAGGMALYRRQGEKDHPLPDRDPGHRAVQVQGRLNKSTRPGPAVGQGTGPVRLCVGGCGPAGCVATIAGLHCTLSDECTLRPADKRIAHAHPESRGRVALRG